MEHEHPSGVLPHRPGQCHLYAPGRSHLHHDHGRMAQRHPRVRAARDARPLRPWLPRGTQIPRYRRVCPVQRALRDVQRPHPLPSGRSSGRVGLRAKNSWPSSNSLPPRGTRCGTGRGYHVRTCSGPSRPSQRRGSFRRNRCLEDIGHRPDNRPPRSRPPRICSGSRSPHSREHTGRPERSSSATRLFRSRFSVRPGISSDD